MTFSAITHCDYTGLIGIENQLAYRSKEDFAEFKKQTTGNQIVLVMGKNTYQECGNLKDRTILALSSKGNRLNGNLTDETIDSLAKTNHIIICGGPKVYEEYLPRCEEVLVHFTKQPMPVPNSFLQSYFPLQIINQLFKPIYQKEFKTFTQVLYKAKSPT